MGQTALETWLASKRLCLNSAKTKFNWKLLLFTELVLGAPLGSVPEDVLYKYLNEWMQQIRKFQKHIPMLNILNWNVCILYLRRTFIYLSLHTHSDLKFTWLVSEVNLVVPEPRTIRCRPFKLTRNKLNDPAVVRWSLYKSSWGTIYTSMSWEANKCQLP